MTDSAAAGDARPAWSELLERGLRRGAEGRLLAGALELLQSETAAGSIGLYRVRDGIARRQAAAGDGRAPAEIDIAAAGAAWVELSPEVGLWFDPPDAARGLTPSHALAVGTSWWSLGLAEQVKRQRFEVLQQGVQLEALYEVGLAIASTLDAEALGDAILFRAVSLLDARRGALYLLRGGRFELDQTLGGDAAPRLSLDEAEVLLSNSVAESGGAGGLPIALPGGKHTLAVPIEADGVRRGLLVVADKESRRGIGPFVEIDSRTLSLFANQAGIALQNADLHREALEKERLESEVELAADIQRRLLPPDLPALPGYEVAGWSRPARHIGGDYYDLLPKDGGLVLLLADVSGKGMPAALLVSTLHSAFRLLIGDAELTPDQLTRLNRHIYDSSASNKFITLFVADLDLERGVLSYISAGHNPAFCVSATGGITTLASGGLPIGMLPRSSYRGADVELAAGDLVCIYSDGITECENREGEEFGERRLAELLSQRSGEPLCEVIEAIDRAVREFAGDAPQGDDQTVVIVRRTA